MICKKKKNHIYVAIIFTDILARKIIVAIYFHSKKYLQKYNDLIFAGLIFPSVSLVILTENFRSTAWIFKKCNT